VGQIQPPQGRERRDRPGIHEQIVRQG
jgi:hypothetical protein